jgi:GNAT superfamily N-acetyltransferase
MDRVKQAPPPLVLTPEVSVDEATARAIESGLDTFNNSIAPCDNQMALWIVGRDSNNNVQAGIYGTTLFDWLIINWLWVADPHRRQGIGSQLLWGAEAIARDRQCTHGYLDTFSFQAPGFYERHGYREFGRINGFPPGHARIWLSKSL